MASLYQKIVADNTDFIVGPLIKENIEAINALPKLDIPVLALNTVAAKKTPEHLFQFGLPPETEAKAIVTKAWQDGHRKSIIIVPDNVWGTRMQEAFQENWKKIGGHIIDIEKIPANSDLSKRIQKLLAINASKDRVRKMRRLGIKSSFTPRRRQDIDMIFIATNPKLARQIKPLLNFHYASNIPVYASSSIYEGKKAQTRNQDLNGIQFCDMPWILDKSITSRNTYRQMAKLWPSQFEQYSRLYALGVDAYKISLQVNHLLLFPDFGISGMTGMLQLDSNKKIKRKLMWARFKNGIAQVTGNPT